MIIATRPPSAARLDNAPQPTHTLHPLEQWIQGTGTDFIAVAAQFGGDPLAVQRPFLGVMQDMHLPEAQQDFAFDSFHFISINDVGFRYMQLPPKRQVST